MIGFRDPLFLLLLILPPLILYFLKRRVQPGAIVYPDTSACNGVSPTWKVWGLAALPWLVAAALMILILGLSRPQLGLKQSQVRREGVDIVLAIDASTSMLAEDFRGGGSLNNRMEVVKKVAGDFIERRPNDRMGIVIFAGKPYILAPITWDHDFSTTRLKEVKPGMIEDGTAIGSGLATAVNRLRESKAKSKVIILLTDGMNNAGQITPEAAAEAAKDMGVIVYTIGAGSKGEVPYPVVDQYGNKQYQLLKVDLDEALLQKIAATTHGRYFRATDAHSLDLIFNRIDKLAKTLMEMPQYQEYIDLYPYFLMTALILLLIETIFANTILRRLP
jgi:Ca-activated chloride channel family protein